LGVTLNGLLARVDATLDRERSFTANASHELRTPLALLRTELELAVRRPRPAEDLTRAIDSAVDEVDRLIRIAEDLLLLASTEDTGLPIAPDQIDVPPFLTGIGGCFDTMAAGCGRHVRVDPGDVDRVEADAEWLRQALMNLITNAFQHGVGEVELSARVVAGATEFGVADCGAGFSDRMLMHGFERFVHSRSGGGSGLGLPIVAAVASAHGGSAGVRNLDPAGCVVWIRLPARL
jgi:signal transduction histidine kinase